MYIFGIGQAILELLSFKFGSGFHQRRNLLNSEIFGNLWKHEDQFLNPI